MQIAIHRRKAERPKTEIDRLMNKMSVKFTMVRRCVNLQTHLVFVCFELIKNTGHIQTELIARLNVVLCVLLRRVLHRCPSAVDVR